VSDGLLQRCLPWPPVEISSRAADSLAVVVVLIWLVYSGPLLLTIGTALGTMYWLGHRGEYLKGSRVPVGLLIGDLAIFAIGLAVIATAPDSQETSNGQVCKDSRDFDEVLYPLVFGSAIVGGLAWGTASLQQDSGFGKLLAYAGIALVLPYAIVVRAFFATACGWN
jgi:hypothetical protein